MHSNLVTKIIYEKIVGEQVSRIDELKDPSIIYATDLVSCTHKFHLRKAYPWLSVVFEPSAVLGSIAHWGLGLLLKEKGFDVEVEVSREVEVSGAKYLLKGRVDAIDKNSKLVVEVKTSRATTGLPKEHHVKQLNIYLNMLEYETGVIVYITPVKILEYTITRTPLDLVEEVRSLVENRYHPRYSWECKYCTYAKLCPYYVEAGAVQKGES